MKSIKTFTILLIGVAIVSRLVPHPPNFTSLSAVAIFSTHLTNKKWLPFLITFIALWISDLIINNLIYPQIYPSYYAGFKLFNSFSIYFAYAVILIGLLFYLKTASTSKIIISGVASAILFFLITNFAVWMNSRLYPPDFSGLILSYISGLPFLLNSIFGNLFYLGLFYGSLIFVRKWNVDEFKTGD
jgi:hypothetical protein